LVHPDFISKLGNERQGILLELPDRLGFNPRNPVGTSTINRYFAQVERNVPEEATVITPYSGTMSLRRATRGAFASWQVISLLVLLSAAAAITCVLTVSFLGRKRSLGIFRVLGGTVADLRRSMALEAAYISLPGIVLGVIAGRRFAGLLETGDLMPPSAYVIAVITGILTMAAGVWMPLQLIKNANCDQLLNNRPVYVISNPSCANCGLCGGI
jgi:predicted lysophospholipase L1 biosynthesis ABC-type transport system permease subunit